MATATATVTRTMYRPTHTQSGPERAIERAGRVLANGRIKSTGQRFWLVSSQTYPERPHLVFLRSGTNRLSCDCPASQHGLICGHRAAVHMHLTVQAARVAALDMRVEATLAEEEAQLSTAAGGAGCHRA